jgi:hypothetical protein
MHHSGHRLDHWTRQFDQSPKPLDTRVFKVVKLAFSPGERDLVIAMTSKQSAKRLIASLSEVEGPDRYRVTAFHHDYLPGLER